MGIILIIYFAISIIVTLYALIDEYLGRRSIYHNKAMPYWLAFYIGIGWLPIIIFILSLNILERFNEKSEEN